MPFATALAATALAGQLLVCPSFASQSAGGDPVVPSIPARRNLAAPPAAPPALLPGAERVVAMTLQVAIRRSVPGGKPQPAAVHQTIMRTADRVRIAPVAGREWLFERNVLDARRAFGSLIDHGAREIVLYDESDLRNILGIRGWSQVLALGFDPDRLATLEPSGQTRSVAGLPFARYASASKVRNAAAEDVWWSPEHLFPGRFVTAEGGVSTIFAVERVQAGVDAAVLLSPAVRFPAYKVVDFAEWLERQ